MSEHQHIVPVIPEPMADLIRIALDNPGIVGFVVFTLESCDEENMQVQVHQSTGLHPLQFADMVERQGAMIRQDAIMRPETFTASRQQAEADYRERYGS